MKRFFMGLIIGMGIMITINVMAEESPVESSPNLVGMTIEGQLPVTVEGVQLETPAIFINGTSFLPVRNFGESVGYDVYFDPQGEILMTKAITDDQLSELERVANLPYEPDDEQTEKSTDENPFEGKTLEELTKWKDSNESSLTHKRWQVEYYEKKYAAEPTEENARYLQIVKDDLQSTEDLIAEIQAAIDALEE